MTKEEKQKAVDALKISAPVMAMTQEEFNDYIQTINQIMDWLEQESCEDAISREAVLKIIDGWYEQNRDTDNIEDLIVLITYMDSVNPQKPCKDCQYKEWLEGEDLPPVTPKQSWIPVSERLPEKYTYTLWCASSGYVRSDYFNGEFWEDAKKLGYEVIAWMPLPEPYTAEGSEAE